MGEGCGVDTINLRAVIDAVEAAQGVARPDHVMVVVRQMRAYERMLKEQAASGQACVAFFLDWTKFREEIEATGQSVALTVTAPHLSYEQVADLAHSAGWSFLRALQAMAEEEE